ncbi:dammarenediol 12-hydroxylase-like [Impatiens glandulifera]|uniref:dammarenediol 12-hydroxylase-like n=1 Tax=Impatiens glandulifera TaxID=253017 RepID=UPI001FB055AB|nr:dammarenediol 12-hydroxylase-like [Impatiens glandulifera]
MDIFLLLSLFLSSIFVFYTFFRGSKTKPNLKSSTSLPPGSRGWPFLGETLDYFDKLWRGVPEKFEHERNGGEKNPTGIFKTSLLGEHMAILCGAEGNKFLFSNEHKLVQLWWPNSINKIFPQSNDEFMKEDAPKTRKIILRFLRQEALQEYIPIIDEVTRNHMKMDWNRDEVKVAPAMSKYTFTLACRMFLSIRDEERVEELRKSFRDVSLGAISMAINLPGTTFNRAIKASKVMRKEIEKMVMERMNETNRTSEELNRDLLSYMIEGNELYDNFMTASDIASVMLGVFYAGTHTLNVGLVFVTLYLAELPHVYNEVLKEQLEIAKSKKEGELLTLDDLKKMKYSMNVVNEALRIMPPSLGMFREAITDFTYNGYLVPKGWKLHVITHSTHKNPKYFPNPEKFDPSRFEGNGPAPFTFFPFGGGPRVCPGSEYARQITLVFVHNLVTRFKIEKQIPDEKIVIDPTPRPVEGLPIRLHPHKQSHNISN